MVDLQIIKNGGRNWKMLLQFGILFVIFASSGAFMPSNFGLAESDYSHKSITEKAVFIAAAKYISKYLQPGVYNESTFDESVIIQGFFKNGIHGQTLLPIANASMAACQDCDFSASALKNRSCDHNIIVAANYLTSGYRGDQDVPKPQGVWANGVGKCSHGGPLDTTQSTPARGGINKDTSDPGKSPHFYLHHTAGEAAVEATVYFLTGNGTGLLDVMGAALFGDFLQIHTTCFNCLDPKLSIGFAIDDTGSMSNDIFAVRKNAIDIVNKAIESDVGKYVLATFNDPVEDNTVRSTTNGDTMKSWLNNLNAHGGGDCPEYAMDGILKGIGDSLPGSCLFIFTDADPKDPELQHKAIEEAVKKDIHLMFFLRGQCSGELQTDNSTSPKCVPKREPTAAGRKRRSAWGMFGGLISSTSASAVKVPAGEIGKTITDIIQASTGINPIYIANFTLDSYMDNYSFPIDSRIGLFTVEVTGESNELNVNLQLPNSTTESFMPGSSATRDNIGHQTVVLSITNSTAGIWTLKRTGSNRWNVIIKGKGDIKFQSQLLEDLGGGMYFPVSGSSPIAGSNLSLSVSVDDITVNSSVDSIVLRSINDTRIMRFNVTDRSTKSSRSFQAHFQVPFETFRITVQGKDQVGLSFRRTANDVIKPVTGNLEILPVQGNLVKDKPTPIYIKVTNAGASRQQFIVTSTDTENYLQGSTQQTVTLDPHKDGTVIFNITGKRELSIT